MNFTVSIQESLLVTNNRNKVVSDERERERERDYLVREAQAKFFSSRGQRAAYVGPIYLYNKAKAYPRTKFEQCVFWSCK